MTETTTTTRAVAYVRVSTDKQADKGQSLEAQQEKIRAYAGLYGIELVEFIVDAGASAKSLEREGLQRALAMIREGQADALIVAKLDRLTRRVADLGTLIDGWFTTAGLLVVGEQIDTRSAAGRLVLNVLMSVAQWEREIIVERTTEAMRHKKAKGEYTGGRPPYGFSKTDDGRLVPDDHEQRVIEAAKQLRAGGLPLLKIAAELDKRGFKARSGKAFGAGQVQKMVA